MKVGRREIVEDVIATVVMAGTVLGYAATHENWNVWLIGDSRRWTAGLLVVLAIAMFALVARHVGSTTIVVQSRTRSVRTAAAASCGIRPWLV